LVREKEKVSKQDALQSRQLQGMEKIVETLEQVDDTVGMLTLDGLLQSSSRCAALHGLLADPRIPC
jgi:tuftelin-interacting protein 11